MTALPKDSTILIKQQFDSFEEFAELAVAWNADFRQLDVEQFKPDMFQARIGAILVSNARLGCHVEQRGSVPPGMRTFAIPDRGSSGMRWFGTNTNADVLLCFPTHGEIDVFSKPGLSVLTLSIPERLLESSLERRDIHELGKTMGSTKTIFQAPPSLLDELRYLLRKAQTIVSLGHGNPVLVDEYQEQLLSTLIRVVNYESPVSTICDGLNRKKLEPILEYIDTHANAPLRITDLCSVAAISERSLQYIFKNELGMTPKAYLAGQRLYGVHRELWHSQPSSTTVADVANHWGFWHMGQFAADYRKIFGELPSSTLTRIL